MNRPSILSDWFELNSTGCSIFPDHFPIKKIDKDPDVRLEPVFVVGETLPVRAASKESKWSRHMPYEYQDKYFYLSKYGYFELNSTGCSIFPDHFPIKKIDKDPDVRLEPVFVVGETLPVRAASKESKWSRHMPYEYQDKYFYLIGPPLLFPVYFQYTSLRHVIIRKCWEDLAWISTFYVKIFLLYYPLFGFWGTVGYFFIVRSVVFTAFTSF
ncbi:hypothetical protein AHF37_04506 [Paragonimus kellicotti]|nr:hypothetical protein AHF37_04506 [Paragonimus kellicotti]